MDLKFDFRQLFRKGKIVDKRLYLNLKDICEHIIVGSPSESSGAAKIVSTAASGATVTDAEILSALVQMLQGLAMFLHHLYKNLFLE